MTYDFIILVYGVFSYWSLRDPEISLSRSSTLAPGDEQKLEDPGNEVEILQSTESYRISFTVNDKRRICTW